MRKFSFGLLITALSVGSAFATDKPEHPKHELTLEQLKWQCQNWQTAPGLQIEPKDIQVQCTQETYRWTPDKPGIVTFPSTRTVHAELFANKFHIARNSAAREAAAMQGSCSSFKEVLESFTIPVAVTCADLLGIEDLNEFCEGKINPSKGGQKPKNVVVVDTGNRYSNCDENGDKPRAN